MLFVCFLVTCPILINYLNMGFKQKAFHWISCYNFTSVIVLWQGGTKVCCLYIVFNNFLKIFLCRKHKLNVTASCCIFTCSLCNYNNYLFNHDVISISLLLSYTFKGHKKSTYNFFFNESSTFLLNHCLEESSIKILET